VNRLGLQEFAAFGGVEVLNARFCEGGTIFAANSGTGFGFAVCTACGYADCEDGLGDGRKNLPRGFESHAPLWRASSHNVAGQRALLRFCATSTSAPKTTPTFCRLKFRPCLRLTTPRYWRSDRSYTRACFAHFRRGYRRSRCSGDLIKFRTRRGRPVVYLSF